MCPLQLSRDWSTTSSLNFPFFWQKEPTPLPTLYLFAIWDNHPFVIKQLCVSCRKLPWPWLVNIILTGVNHAREITNYSVQVTHAYIYLKMVKHSCLLNICFLLQLIYTVDLHQIENWNITFELKFNCRYKQMTSTLNSFLTLRHLPPVDPFSKSLTHICICLFQCVSYQKHC